MDNNVIDLIREYWHDHLFTYFTLDDLRVYLKSKLGEEWDVSNSTLARALKRNIGMTYKKVNWVHPSIWLHENKRKMLESVDLQIKLAQDGVD